ncbi:MAG TPA: polyprenyl synthetase family protein [Dehalococcoidia bacterium]|nr:polyprenyl synthetase family protein [Dehalococcoidia bacterium]
MEGPEILYRYRPAIELEVKRALGSQESVLADMLRYQLGWTPAGLPNLAKCLRPSLCLLACEGLGGDLDKALPIAVAVELVHNFSLIHDDIEDGDDTRHHRATLWRAFGRDSAVVAGIDLWTVAYQTMSHAQETGLAAETVFEARRLLNDACSEMIEGQHQDLTYEQRTDVTLDEYIEMIGRKSGALISASLQLGALVAGAGADQIESFGAFGRNLGLAFQIRDDILGIWGEGSATGKPVGADIARKKKSLPVVHALQQAVGPDRDALRAVYTKTAVEDADVDNVLDILQRWNCRYFAQGLAENYRSRAMSALARTVITSDARYRFDELTAFILERDY